MGAVVRRTPHVDGAEGRRERPDEVRRRHAESRHRRAGPDQPVHADRPRHARRHRRTSAHLAGRKGRVPSRGTAPHRRRADGPVRLIGTACRRKAGGMPAERVLTPTRTRRNKRARSYRPMPFSKPIRFAYAFALAFPLALANPVEAAQARKQPGQAVAELQQAAPRDTTQPLAVSTQDAEDTRRQLEDVLKAYPSTLPLI